LETDHAFINGDTTDEELSQVIRCNININTSKESFLFVISLSWFTKQNGIAERERKKNKQNLT